MLRFSLRLVNSKVLSDHFIKAFSSAPELAKTRFPNVHRGNFNKLSSEHVNFFKSVLGNTRVLQDPSDVEAFNIDFAKHIKGKVC